MRKIFQFAPDVPQSVANKAIEIIERQFAAYGVKRAEDLPEESKVRLLRELQAFFADEFPPDIRDKKATRHSQGIFRQLLNWLRSLFSNGDSRT
ncbi:MAG: hypothetical protein QHH26_04680 [Armatimonadota bacterium]|nr:hypothetical protein [Armatimonadota bacterium]